MKPNTALSPSIPAEAMEYTAYEKQLVSFLFELLAEIVERHEPRIVPMLRGELRNFNMPESLLGRALQAQGIWFLLLSITEENPVVRRRRQLENERGYENVRGIGRLQARSFVGYSATS